MKTNTTLKKSSLLAALLIILIMSCNAQKPRKIEKEFKRAAKEMAEKHEWLSFDVYRQNFRNDTLNWSTEYNVILHYDKKNPAIYVKCKDPYDDVYREEYLLTKHKSERIEHNNNNIIVFKNKHVFWDYYHSFSTMDDLSAYFMNIGYFLYPTQSKIKSKFCIPGMVVSKEVVDINGQSYSKYHTLDPFVTTEFKIFYDRTHTFINNTTGLIDSVYCFSTSKLHNDKVLTEGPEYVDEYGNIFRNYYKIDNYNFDSKQHIFDSVFDLTDARYNDYSRYDEKTFYQYRPYSQNKTANDDLLDYPLVNLQGDTTSIREQEGWVLLNFWTTGCGPCIEHLKEYAHEIDSLGYRVLEKEGIKILAIEHKSDDMELIAKRARLTNSKDIMYSGKGIGATINLPALGYYYLISPNKEIVYETGDLGDYSEIINKLKIER